jgi:hypothetical protein
MAESSAMTRGDRRSRSYNARRSGVLLLLLLLSSSLVVVVVVDGKIFVAYAGFQIPV